MAALSADTRVQGLPCVLREYRQLSIRGRSCSSQRRVGWPRGLLLAFLLFISLLLFPPTQGSQLGVAGGEADRGWMCMF